MSKTNCNAIRRELDEMNLEEEYSGPVTLHLRQCAECQDFRQSRIKLRELVGSLETVEAPADFDSRLRARLANEKAGVPSGRIIGGWSLGTPSVVLAVLVLLVGAVVLLNHWRSPRATVAANDTHSQGTGSTAVAPQGTDATAALAPIAPESSVSATRSPKSAFVPVSLKPRHALATRDFSLSAAEVVKREESMARAGVPGDFPIDTSYQSLKVSLDDGSGNWRTISLPTVSFGSQRVLAPGSNRLAPKGIW